MTIDMVVSDDGHDDLLLGREQRKSGTVRPASARSAKNATHVVTLTNPHEPTGRRKCGRRTQKSKPDLQVWQLDNRPLCLVGSPIGATSSTIDPPEHSRTLYDSLGASQRVGQTAPCSSGAWM